MLTTDFDYQLPDGLIAYFPKETRSASKLLCMERATGEIQHRQFNELLSFLRPEDLLVFNNTRVIPARLYGHKASGGRVELLIERILEGGEVLTQIKASKSPKPGSKLIFPAMKNPAGKKAGDPDDDEAVTALVLGRRGEFFHLEFQLCGQLLDYLEQIGHIPLPPYIKRKDRNDDRERYQTVYSKNPGAVAAPTAGLHFDHALMHALQQRGIATAFVTLHVGAGTFQSVRVNNIDEHKMHSEWFEVSQTVVDQVAECRQRQGRVFAVGTTTVRSLESAAKTGQLTPCREETDIFIYPGYEFKVVDAMITNFHLPQSTLLMLVSAFAGKEKILDAYAEAINEKYRFFSYGDAMLIY